MDNEEHRNEMRNTRLRLVPVMVLVSFSLVSLSTIPAATAVKAVIVSDVRGFNDYIPGSTTLTHGSTLKVYAGMEDVNYDGFVAVKFFFVIKDPRGHVVAMDDMEVTRRDYERDAYVVYTKTIPSWWLYGDYQMKIYAYNRLDKAKIDELERKVETPNALRDIFNTGEFDDLRDFFESGSDAEDMGVVKPLSESLEEITSIRFSVRQRVSVREAAPAAGVTPAPGAMLSGTNFQVTDMWLDRFTVKPNESVGISVSVRNTGARGTGKIVLVINGEKEAEASLTLDPMESKTLHFSVTRRLPGAYKITIQGTGIIRFLYVEEEEKGSAGAEGGVAEQLKKMSGGEGEASLFGGVNNWVWGIFSIYKQRVRTEKVLLSSVFDLSTHQISLTKVLSSFIF